MWYAIFIIAGLSLGLGMMFWALSERKKRVEAEKAEGESRRIAENNIVRVEEVLDDLARSEVETALVSSEVNRLRSIIVSKVSSDVAYDLLLSGLDGTEL